MAVIILARHGQTEWNAAEIFRGRIDIELDETGIKQAGLLAEYLSDVKIEAIYSSPLQRALRTAQIIANYHRLEVEIASGLIDLDYGKWQGLPHQEVKDKDEEHYRQWINSPHRVEIPEGENLDDVRDRAIGVVDEIIAKHGGTVILVSHRVVNKVLICALLGLDNSRFWNIRQDLCGITTFACEKGQFILTEHNNTSFLEPIQKAPVGDF